MFSKHMYTFRKRTYRVFCFTLCGAFSTSLYFFAAHVYNFFRAQKREKHTKSETDKGTVMVLTNQSCHRVNFPDIPRRRRSRRYLSIVHSSSFFLRGLLNVQQMHVYKQCRAFRVRVFYPEPLGLIPSRCPKRS